LWRYRLIRASLRLLTRLFSTVRVEGGGKLPREGAILCFSHQNWADPFFIFGWLPGKPRLYFFGPEQEDMTRGFRNRLMRWGGVAVPYQPGKRGLIAATRRVDEILGAGSSLAIAGEGRIHAGERVILPLLDGPAFMAARSGRPIVPVAVNGTFWLGFRRVVRIRVGQPIIPAAPSSAEIGPEVAELTARARSALSELVADFPDRRPPGRIGRWLTELFNDWPEGSRPDVGPR
jgi:1-acyl-sn-glycerol-3-phosphate acyltransferase/cytidylate kinase